jgi:hypothetical protein
MADRQTVIYNNTAYIGKGHSPNAVQAGRYGHHPELPTGIVFIRNVFFNEGDLTFDWKASNVSTNGNCYFGNPPKSPLKDANMVKGKAMPVSGVPIHEWKEATIYSIPAGSGCDPMSPALPNAGGVDFVGTPASEKTVGTRGAIFTSIIAAEAFDGSMAQRPLVVPSGTHNWSFSASLATAKGLQLDGLVIELSLTNLSELPREIVLDDPKLRLFFYFEDTSGARINCYQAVAAQEYNDPHELIDAGAAYRYTAKLADWNCPTLPRGDYQLTALWNIMENPPYFIASNKLSIKIA